ncbi:type III secretion system protein [Aeromonas veronii]|uniref:type III secretion system protein n=1 Tax=Aeromonas veronii TaxID=654 RepID=UPI00207C72E7|nr:type III secretion system protein [Aeromonas veronii]MCO4174549.1 type III secretion system protein [Aeromonas veronii]
MSSIVSNSLPSNVTFAEKSYAQNTVTVNDKEWHRYSDKLNEVETGSVSMSNLLFLLAQIIESSQRLRAQMMQNRITEAVATSDLAVKISGDKCSDTRRKFGITLAASVATMAMSTAATVRMGQSKTLKDKHVTDLTKGKNTSVSSLDSSSVNKFTANLQEARTAKFRSVSQMSDMASGMVGNVNEMQHADQVRKQEETQASKELKEKFDAQLDLYIQDLTQEAMKLNEILDSVAKASLVNNR